MPKFPPYGAKLHAALCDGFPLDNSIYLYCGYHAWKRARNMTESRTLMLCLPPWLSPREFDWPVANADVLIFDTGNCDEEYIEEIAFVLFEHNADVVRANMYGDDLILFK